MDKLLYVGMNAAKNTQLAQATTVNNLANASTPGFRGDFHVLLSAQVEGPYFDSRINSVSHDRTSSLQQGPVQYTGGEWDIAIDGDGWLAVQADDGTEAYSRRGDLRLTAEGMLVNGANQMVMGENGPLSIPEYSRLLIGNDGTISVVPKGEASSTMISLDRLKLVKLDPTQVIKRDDGLMAQRDGMPGEPDASVRVRSGYIEGANISAVDSMVSMINHSRMYEMQVKLMRTAETMAENSSRLMRME